MSNKKVLFVSSNIASSKNGGWVCSRRNLDTLKQIFGSNNVEVFVLQPFILKKGFYNSLKAIIGAVIRTVFIRINGATFKIERYILEKVLSNNISTVFVDSSINGTLIKRLHRRTNVKIVAFFHNCEFQFNLYNIRNGAWYLLPRLYSCYFNEKLTIKHSDKIITLNKRDEDLISKLYSKKGNIFNIPISIEDTYEVDSRFSSQVEASSKLNILFVGSNFFPNRVGILWFINNVMPYVEANLSVVGREMNKIAINETENIKVFSSVDSLESFYREAHVVIAPIFDGGGMKVKIAEAMMYGKQIIATTESLQGYERNKFIHECNTTQEFIDTLNNLEFETFIPEVRELFLNNYSFVATKSEFDKIFK